MAKVKIQGNASGTGVLTVTAPNTSTDRTITLPDATGTLLNSDGDGSNLTGISSVGGATGVDFNDNVKARFGTGNDLEIYHSGSHSIINETGDGYLIVQTDGTGMLFQKGTTEDMAKFLIDGAVELYHDNSKKFETTATGVAVTGGVAIGGTGTANTLDDYEEGTWTPTILGTTSISMRTVYNSHYTKVGNVVTLYTAFALNSSATPATGALRFGGFPFAFKTLGEGSFPIQLYYSYKETPMAYMAPNGYCYYQNTNVGGNNSAGLNEGIFNNVNRNNMGMTFSYLTDA